jgi:hypothetical protein
MWADSARQDHGFFKGSSPPAAYRFRRVSQEPDMIFEPAHRSRRDERQRRVVRRRIRETLAVRRAAAVGEHGAAQPPDESPAESQAAR